MRKFLTIAFLLTLATVAFAQEPTQGQAFIGAANNLLNTKFLAFIGVGGAAAACGTAQGRALAAAFEGIARNPQAADKISGSLVLGLAFIEALVLFTFALVFLVK